MFEIGVLLYPVFFLLLYFGINLSHGIGYGVRFYYLMVTFMNLGLGPFFYLISGNYLLFENINYSVLYCLLCEIYYVVLSFYLWPVVFNRFTILRGPGIDSFVKTKNYDFIWKSSILIGFFIGPLFASFFGGIDTVRAFASHVLSLSELGIALLVFKSARNKNSYLFYFGLLVFMSLSLFRAVTSGFFGGSLIFGMYLFCLYFFHSKITLKSMLYVFLIGALGFIPYQGWLVSRGEIRNSIAAGGNDLSVVDRLNLFFDGMSLVLSENKDEGFDNRNFAEKYADRGDFMHLMQSAIEHTPDKQPFAMGETYENALISWIPRFIWPDKPFVLGGSAVVSRFTGIKFSDNVSVGMNYIFEAYINFGFFGGFLAITFISFVLTGMDVLFLSTSKSLHVIAVGLLAIGICSKSDTFADMVMTSGSAFVVAFVFWVIIEHLKPDLG